MIRNYQSISINRKLLFGFGAIVLVIVVLVLFSSYSGLSVNGDLQMVEELARLKTASAEMVEAFSLAQGYAQVMFTRLYHEDDYQACRNYLRQAQSRLTEMESYAEAAGGYYEAEIEPLAGEMAAWSESVIQVRQLQTELEKESEVLITSAQTVADNALLIHDRVSTLTAELALESDAATTAHRISNIIVPAGQIGDTASLMQREVAHLALDYNLNSVDDLYAALITIREVSAQVYPLLTTAEAREALRLIGESLDIFEVSLDSFTELMMFVATEIGAASNTMELLYDHIGSVNNMLSLEVNSLLASSRNSSTRTTVITMAVALLAIIAAVLISLGLSRNLTRRINLMQEVLLQIGERGRVNLDDDLQQKLERESQIGDELGRSIASTQHLLRQFSHWADCLQRIAGGDLSTEVALLSDDDALGHALRQMSNSLNYMFDEINQVSGQVASGAMQIATGSQNLAEGATQQSATIQLISSSMREINRKADASMQTAKQAAKDSDLIRASAHDGNVSMERMVRAMEDISAASHAIEQVNKAIDEIAFQTSILALNASVEAAHAGDQGKGFAVVAEEVRNLASKSAGAAKQTAELIASNIAKAEMGLAISQETAASLAEIVYSIQKTGESLEALVNQSEGVNQATQAINGAVEQVADVVSQNSATSEESAAASQQMSSQAQVLQELLARFKLKNTFEVIQGTANPWDLLEEEEQLSLPG